ncbi:hypothetical protein WA158_005671 [Blastocystis sp. Blastoise]
MTRIIDGEVLQDNDPRVIEYDKQHGRPTGASRPDVQQVRNRFVTLESMRRERQNQGQNQHNQQQPQPKKQWEIQQDTSSFPQFLCSLLGIKNYLISIPFTKPEKKIPLMYFGVLLLLYYIFGAPLCVSFIIIIYYY